MILSRFFSSRPLLPALVFCLLLALPARAQSTDSSDLAARISNLEAELQTMQQHPAGAAGGTVPTGSVATSLEVRVTNLENAIRDLNGQLERAQYADAQLQARLDKMSADLDVRFDLMQKKIDALPAAPPVVPAAVAAPAPAAATSAPAAAAALAAPQLTPPAQTAPVTAPAPTAVPAPEAKKDAKKDADKDDEAETDLTPQQQYDRAFASLRQSKYADAETGFKDFIAQNPGDALAPSARYWLGQTYYVRNMFNEAAVTFAEAYEKAPKSPKAPESLLKLGMSLAALGKKQDACVAFREIGSKYPNASASVRNMVVQEIKKNNCGS